MSLENLRTILALSVSLVMLSATGAHAETLAFEHVMNIGADDHGERQFKYVEDFAFSKEGHLLATDASRAWVQVFNKATGKFPARSGGNGDDDCQLDKPEGIAVDSDGNVFIADYITELIKKYNASYK